MVTSTGFSSVKPETLARAPALFFAGYSVCKQAATADRPLGKNSLKRSTFSSTGNNSATSPKRKKFRHILSWAYRKHPEEFSKALSVEGNRRKYFAGDEKT